MSAALLRARYRRGVLFAAFLVAAGQPGHAPLLAQPTASPSCANAQGAPAALRALLAASDEAYLRRNPIQAVYRGEARHVDHLGPMISPAYYAAERRAARHDLAALSRIDRSRLNGEDQISYDAFRFGRANDLAGLSPALIRLRAERPIDHFDSFQIWMPDLSSGDGAARFRSAADYDDNLKRLHDYVALMDRSIALMKQGLRDGITNPGLVMAHVVEQLDTMISEGIEGSTYFKPVSHFPDAIAQPERDRIRAAYAAFIRDHLLPAHVRLRDFIQNAYLPRARATVGLGDMPGGAALYRHLVASATTTDLDPAEIHRIGLSEVDRIHAELETVKAAMHFSGTLAQLADVMRTDPRFAPASPAAMRSSFAAINDRVMAAIGRDFSLLPKSPLDIRPVPDFKAKTEAAASYEPGTPDGDRPGIFYYNSADLPSRFTWTFEAIFLHEAIPGHHFQVSLAQENLSLPPSQRFVGGNNIAFIEGWGLYAESLGGELGLYTDPHQLYGRLNMELLRAMRLVVDTGIHAQGWTRERAIAYLLENSAMSRTDATAEVERYIALPADALAYKIGELTIQRLRRRAETQLGKDFDIRAFHAQLLGSGALPLSVLERKIDGWIAATRRH